MRASVCIATYEHPRALRRVLDSIVGQRPPFEWETIIVDDGSPTDETAELCRRYPVRYIRRWRQPGYGNPGIARNIAYQAAIGEVLICQSDDVVHGGSQTIQRLVEEMEPGRFVVANVVNADEQLRPTPCLHPRNPTLIELAGPIGKRPLLFLGAVYRRDVYAIGGNEERFTAPGREDMFFVQCLMKSLGLVPYFSTVKGYHLHHDRPPAGACEPSGRLYQELARAGRWLASGAPWPDTLCPDTAGLVRSSRPGAEG